MKTLITIIILALLVWGGYTLINRDGAEMTPTNNEAITTPTPTPTPSPVSSTPTIREIAVTGSNFAFSTSTIRVKRGDTVRIVFKSQGTHDWVIDEFNKRTKVLSAGQSETIEFVADKTGSFEYYCSVGTHRQMGMKGTLIVE